jgi:hypothetical protein
VSLTPAGLPVGGTARNDAVPMDMPAAGMAAATAFASRLGVTAAPDDAATTRRPHATSTATVIDLKLALIPESLRADADPQRATIHDDASGRPNQPVRFSCAAVPLGRR